MCNPLEYAMEELEHYMYASARSSMINATLNNATMDSFAAALNNYTADTILIVNIYPEEDVEVSTALIALKNKEEDSKEDVLNATYDQHFAGWTS